VSTALVVWLALTVWWAGVALTARHNYRFMRPWKEPLACKDRERHRVAGDHVKRCYRRWSDVDTESEAVAMALTLALPWPFLWPLAALVKFVKGGSRPLPEETAVQLERLEKENDKLKRQQEARREIR